MNDLAVKIENLLRNSKNEPVKMRQIKLAIGKKNDRHIRDTIELMRQNGHLILSGSKGYWYAKDFDEYKQWADFMYSYIGNLSHTVKTVGDCAVQKFNQCYQPPLIR